MIFGYIQLYSISSFLPILRYVLINFANLSFTGNYKCYYSLTTIVPENFCATI